MMILRVITLNSDALLRSNLKTQDCFDKQHSLNRPCDSRVTFQQSYFVSQGIFVLVGQIQLRMPPLMCPLSLSPCSMSLMSSKSSLITLIK